MSDKSRLRVLCVDDEPNVLEGLTLHLRRRYDVATAVGGPAALELLRRDGPPAIVISDMRMPVMNGAAVLAKVRELSPDTIRILLTGQSDIESAIAAINEGQIFRFLTKPCPPPVLLSALEAAAEQHRLITSERVLLEQTLHGSIKMLVDLLSLTHPASFGRAMRVKQLVTELAEKVRLPERWQVEVAAMLSQIAWVTLPAEVGQKVHEGQPLSEEEKAMVARLPAVTEQLLGNIPRLEVVRGILARQQRSARLENDYSNHQKQLIFHGAQLLRVAMDFDALEARGSTVTAALTTMREHGGYDPTLLEAIATLRGVDFPRPAESVRNTEAVRVPEGLLRGTEAVRVPEGLRGTEAMRVPENLRGTEAVRMPESLRGTEAVRVPESLRGTEAVRVPESLRGTEAVRVPEGLRDAQRDEVRELPLKALCVGMVLAEDLKSDAGMLLVARGDMITASFIERCQHLRPGSVKEPVRVLIRARKRQS